MKWILYNPESEDLEQVKNVHKKDLLIIDMKDRYPDKAINFNNKKQEYRRISQLWLQKWSYTCVDGKSIKEHFSKDDQTYFYLLSYFFQRYFEKEGFLFKDRAGVQLTFMLTEILDDFITDDIKIISRDPHENHFISIAEKICFEKQHNAIVIKKPYKSKNNYLRKHPELLKQLIKARIKARWWIGSKGRPLNSEEKGKVIFLSSYRFSRAKPTDNTIFGNIIKKMDIPNKIIDYDPPDPKYLGKALFSLFENYLGDYYTLKVLRDNDLLCKEFKEKWLSIRRSPELIRSIHYKGINLYSEVEPWFDLIFDSIFYLIADCINITKKVLEYDKPACIVLDHEENFYGKGFMINAKKTGTPIVALQHEAILPDDTNHFHIKDEAALIKSQVFWRPLPDKKCVGDKEAKKILIDKCNYPPGMIVVTGRPEFDDLVAVDDLIVPTPRPIILYAVEYFETTKKFLAATKGMNYMIIIKPHPESNMDDYKKLCKDYNVMLANKSDNTHKLIKQSDLVITDFCMVGVEAMIARKPFLLYNPNYEPDIYDFKKSGVPEAKSPAALRSLIKSMIDDPERYIRLTKDYVKRYDGKASQRIVEVIKNCLTLKEQ